MIQSSHVDQPTAPTSSTGSSEAASSPGTRAQTTAAQAIQSVSHAWDVQHEAWNNGRMDNWLPAHIASDGADVGPYTMGYFTRDDIPFQYALADAFTVLDSYHCSVLGPTAPNRLFWMTGSIDPRGLHGGPIVQPIENLQPGALSWTTFPERLEEAGAGLQLSPNASRVLIDLGLQPRLAPRAAVAILKL